MKNYSLIKGIRTIGYSFILGIYLYSPSITASNSVTYSTLQQEPAPITGTITDGIGPMPGVTITVKGRSTTTISDYTGQYSITASPTDVLVFSFMGFKTVEVVISSQKIVNIQLKEDATALQEVRVNAGYYSVKEKERTGSIAKITAKDIETQPVNSPLAAMQGRMTGVNITQETGAPGGGFNIQIRGINSIRSEGNEPLYIVDGVPFASQSLADPIIGASAIKGLANPLNNLNPADIQNIEVLKDADATAIYGSRGSNGVVLITTKKGIIGATRFELNSFTSIGKVSRTLNVMNTKQYLAMRKEAFANDGISQYPADAFDINGTWSQNRETNWAKNLIGGTAQINNLQASFSGGTATTQYLLSGTFRRETTVFPGDSHYGKGAFHSNLNHTSVDQRFSLNFSTNYTSDSNNLPGRDLTSRAYTLAPNAPDLYDSKGKLNWEDGTFNNPLAFLESKYKITNKSIVANALLSYEILTGLQAKTSFGYTETSLMQTITNPLTSYNPFDTSTHEASLYIGSGTGSSWIIEPQLNYKGIYGLLDLDFLIGTTFQNQETSRLAQVGSGFTSDALINNLNAASTLSIINHERIEYRYNAAFARVNLKWNERYILNLTGRRDGSSRFGAGKRFANFGAIGAAWIFSNELFLKKNKNILSFGKLRSSYGTSGSDQIGDYQYLDTYEVSNYLYNGIAGLAPSRLYNPDFGWETNKKFEVSLELGFLRDNIFLTSTWFKNRSSNQLVGIPLPGTTGFSSIQSNLAATVQNTGLEVELRTVNLKNNKFSWISSLNVTLPKNKLVAFPNLDASTYANSLVIGESLSIRKVFDYTGIDPVSGAYTFRDYNNDGQITFEADRQKIADTSPQFYGGFSNQLSLRNWSFDFLFQFVSQQGRNYRYTSTLAGTFVNQPVEIVSHFPQDNSTAIAQQYSTGANSTLVQAAYNFLDSNAAFSDASFIRLKTVSLSYRIPSPWSKTVSATVYAQGQNFLTFTKFKGADPENQSVTSLPPLRQFTLGFRLAF
ncbi:SusC/RagA family TonB-linked outer membrane protein [Flavobacterium weaverense]|uniref:TonB-linked SusC/RagA family outer membrane protein n=1 Tax=Flavobacterium weaverense TaxID=271156 RepID=A0A3M0A228_9FLAO|nr:SusC/RagA family TonB-linked outer membrane protein [Flavobacterium weaverense]RMA73062.1 TonB-linked SusC/RagA family outer membrane protein [Flavobacterium weaverense]